MLSRDGFHKLSRPGPPFLQVPAEIQLFPRFREFSDRPLLKGRPSPDKYYTWCIAHRPPSLCGNGGPTIQGRG